MSRKRRNRRKQFKPQKPSPYYILGVYEMFDDDDISTERLLAMVADSCGCDIDDVVEALQWKEMQNESTKTLLLSGQNS